jgi:DNA-binding NtrC family response regulator
MDDSNVRVLAIGPQETDLAVLARILSHSAWTFVTAATLAEAAEQLESSHFHVVLSERKLADGDWKKVLEITSRMVEPAQLIVLSRDGDERLWAEVLNLGAWDVLVKPFHPKEVYRTIHSAWQHGSASVRRRPADIASTSRPAAAAPIARVAGAPL